MLKIKQEFEVITSKAHYKVSFKPNEDIRENLFTISYNYPHRGGIIIGNFELKGHFGRTYIFQAIDTFDEVIDKLFL